MAIAFDTSAGFNFVSGNNDLSITVGTNPNNYMLVVSGANAASMSYNGVSLTNIISFTPAIHDGNEQSVYVWALANPDSGTHNLNVPYSGAFGGSVSAVVYSGVEAIGQPEAQVNNYSNNGTNNTQVGTLASSVTTITNKAWSVMFTCGTNGARTFTASQGTLRQTDAFIFGDGSRAVIDSNSQISPAGTSTLEATWSSLTGFMSNVIISLKPTFESSGTFMPYFI